ncbi:MAG TPA: AI-2E family transporter [Acidobacteriaceae bacterium]
MTPSQSPEQRAEIRPAALESGSSEVPRKIVLFCLTALGVIGCVAMILAFVPAITWAVALAVATQTPSQWLAAKVRRPSFAAILSVVLVLLLLVCPVALLLYNLGSQLLSLIDLVRSGAAQDWVAQMLAAYPRIDQVLTHAKALVSLREGSQAAAGYLGGKLQDVLTGSVRAITQVGIMLFTLFFLYKDGDKARSAFQSILPVRVDQAKRLIRRMADTISSSLQGSVLIAAVQGSLGGLMFWALAVPQAFLWAFLMGLLALIPSLGTFLIWMPVAIFLALSGHVIKAIILLAWGLGVISTVDNLLYPTLVGNRLRLHTIPIFFAVLGGIALFGLSGLVLGPLLLTTTLELLHLWSPAILPLKEPRDA